MIRPLLPAAAAQAALIIRTAFAAIDPPLDPPPSGARVTADDVARHLLTGGGALHGGDGCVLWTERESGLYLSRLSVLPAAWGRGIAAALIGHVEQQARQLGLPRVHLEVRLALAGNRRLFARMGFTETALHTHPGYSSPTFVAAEKWL